MRETDEGILRLCALTRIGEPLTPVSSLSGGYMHEALRLDTRTGTYVAKRLNPLVMRHPGVADNMRRSEAVARMARSVVPACAAYLFSGDPIIPVGNDIFMLYDFVPGRALTLPEIMPSHCRAIGAILKKLHALPFSGALRDSSGTRHDWALLCPAHAEALFRMQESACAAVSALAGRAVLSHNDLDPKNVLWDKGAPCLIDWEAAGAVCPARDFTDTAMYWTDGEAQKLRAFFEGYGAISADWRAALEAGYGARLDWLAYNLRRASGEEASDENERELGVRQAEAAWEDLTRYASSLAGRAALFETCAAGASK